MQLVSTQFPFAYVSYGQQPFGIRVRCVLDSSFLTRQNYTTGLAIEATGGMQPYFGLGPFAKGVVQNWGQTLGAFLGKLDKDGGTSILYWGTNDPTTLQPLGFRTAEQWQHYSFVRPISNFGRNSRLQPALKYFLEGDHLAIRPTKRGDSYQSIFIYFIDGPLDDFPIILDYLGPIAIDIIAQRRSDRFVFVGLGENFVESSQGQIQALAAYSGHSDPPIITSLVVREITTVVADVKEAIMSYVKVAKSGIVFDSKGQLARKFAAGLPGAFQFYLPSGSKAFTIEIDGNIYKQELLS